MMGNPTTDADYRPIEFRRVQRFVKEGHAYDPQDPEMSRIWHEESKEPHVYFAGIALYQHVSGSFWLHKYTQWDRECYVAVDLKSCIQATEHHRPHQVEEIFGRLYARGAGPAYTPIPPPPVPRVDPLAKYQRIPL